MAYFKIQEQAKAYLEMYCLDNFNTMRYEMSTSFRSFESHAFIRQTILNLRKHAVKIQKLITDVTSFDEDSCFAEIMS